MTENTNNEYTSFDWDNSQYIKKLEEKHNDISERSLNELKNMLDFINGKIAINLIQFLKEKDVLIKNIFIDVLDFDIDLENVSLSRKYRFCIKDKDTENIGWNIAEIKINKE